MEGWRVENIYNRTMELIRTGSPLSTGPRDRAGRAGAGPGPRPRSGSDHLSEISDRARHARRNGKAERNAQITKTYVDTT